jgi:hypothetical protein
MTFQIGMIGQATNYRKSDLLVKEFPVKQQKIRALYDLRDKYSEYVCNLQLLDLSVLG